MLKRLFLLLLTLLLCCSSAIADCDPAPLLAALDESWDGWTIPTVTHGKPGEYACNTFPEYGYAMALLTNKGANILCIFEFDGDAWQLSAYSSGVPLQGEWYPRISDEFIAGNGLIYLHGEERHPHYDLAVAITRNDELGWHVESVEMMTKLCDYRIISFLEDGGISYRRFAGDEDEHIVPLDYDNRISAFSWTTLPQSFMQAEKAVAPYTDPVDALE